MNDYKELIAKLRFYANTADDPIYGICINSPKVMLQAADAIEQLVKERDDWMGYAKQERKRSIERYHELAVELDRVKKERDAIYADMKTLCTSVSSICDFCKNNGENICEECICTDWFEFWEWRGERSETDVR